MTSLVNISIYLPRQLIEKHIAYGDLLRKDPLQNQDVADQKSEGDETVFDEEMKTWHRETSSPGKTFLQFNLDQGTQTDISADGAREGEAGDQALAIVQGSSKKSTNKDFSDLEALEKQDTERGEGGSPFGNDNKNAEAIFIKSTNPTDHQKVTYQEYYKQVIFFQKKLKRTIDLTLEHKKSFPQTNMQFGRLDKKFIRFFTDEQPRLFYKKQNDSKDIDAAFSLLIDCSASMQDKMEETKRGIILFHEALKAVKVPHEVTGFWEDASFASNKHQPNYFKQVINYQTSLVRKSGPEIMDLRAEEDNRDGFAITSNWSATFTKV